MRTAPSRSVYLLSGRFVTIPEMMEMLERLSGARKPRLCLSYGFLRPFMPLVETYYRLFGRPPRFTRESLSLLHLGVQVDSSRARAELGHTSRPLEETLTDTVEWFRENGYVRH